MFLHVSVILSTGGACMVAPRGHAWLLWGRGHAWLLGGHAWLLQGGHAWLVWGACVVAPGGMCGCSGGVCAWLLWGGMCGCSGGHAWLLLGGHAWDTTRYGDTINERAVRILLECILVGFRKLFPLTCATYVSNSVNRTQELIVIFGNILSE